MKNFGVLAVFLFSLLAFGATLAALSVPEPVEGLAKGKWRSDGGTRDEEELTIRVDSKVAAGQLGFRIR